MVGRLVQIESLLGMFCLAGCAGPGWSTTDSWDSSRNGQHQYVSTGDCQAVPFSVVRESEHDRAERLLRDLPWVDLTTIEASGFSNEELSQRAGSRFFLVRGLIMPGKGGFTVCVFPDEVVTVSYFSVVPFWYIGTVPMKRCPLVIQLPRQPRALYVSRVIGD